MDVPPLSDTDSIQVPLHYCGKGRLSPQALVQLFFIFAVRVQIRKVPVLTVGVV